MCHAAGVGHVAVCKFLGARAEGELCRERQTVKEIKVYGREDFDECWSAVSIASVECGMIMFVCACSGIRASSHPFSGLGRRCLHRDRGAATHQAETAISGSSFQRDDGNFSVTRGNLQYRVQAGGVTGDAELALGGKF